MNLWQNWLSLLTQSQQTAVQNAASWNTQISRQFTSQYAEQWQQACKQWQSSIEGAWTSPASFWQAVASIQSARARFIAEFCQQQPQYLAQLFQCTSYPQLVECLTRWNGHTLTSLTNLNMVTQAQRSNLLNEWKHSMPWSSNAKALANMWNANNFWKSTTAQQNFTNFGNSSSPKSQGSASSATSTWQTASQSSQPSAASHSTMTPVTQTSTTQNQTSPITAHVSVPTPAPLATPVMQSVQQEQFSLVTNSTPQISSTADSVMRTSTGNTIAAAAARRSVVARRSSSNRRRASR